MDLLDWEVEPLAVGLVNGLFEGFEVFLPVLFVFLLVTDKVPCCPVFAFPPGLNLLSWVVLGPRNDEVFVGISGKCSHDVQLLQLESHKHNQPEQSKCAGR